MFLSDILIAVFGGLAFWAVAIMGSRAMGYRLEFRITRVRRRRGPSEPDEHTAFL